MIYLGDCLVGVAQVTQAPLVDETISKLIDLYYREANKKPRHLSDAGEVCSVVGNPPNRTGVGGISFTQQN